MRCRGMPRGACGAPHGTTVAALPCIASGGSGRVEGLTARWGFRAPPPPSAGKRWPQGTSARSIPMTAGAVQGNACRSGRCRPTTPKSEPKPGLAPTSWPDWLVQRAGTVLVLIDARGVSRLRAIALPAAPATARPRGRCWPIARPLPKRLLLGMLAHIQLC